MYDYKARSAEAITCLEVLLERRVLDDRHHELLVVAIVRAYKRSVEIESELLEDQTLNVQTCYNLLIFSYSNAHYRGSYSYSTATQRQTTSHNLIGVFASKTRQHVF